MDSIIQDEKECFICHTTQNLNLHHIFFGNKHHKISDREGFVCYLCTRHHHMSNEGVHKNRELDLQLKQIAQAKYEETHTREQFMSLMGRNYL